MIKIDKRKIDLKNYFDSLDEDGEYDKSILGKIASYFKNKQLNIFSKIINKLSVSSIFEVGVGAGKYMALVPDSVKISGCDISKHMINIAEKNTKGKYIIADAENLPLKDGSFDMVLCFDMLHHYLPETKKNMIREFCRVAKKYVLIDVKNKINPWYWFGYEKNNEAGYAVAYTSKEIGRYLINGFKIKKVIGVGFPISIIAPIQIIICKRLGKI